MSGNDWGGPSGAGGHAARDQVWARRREQQAAQMRAQGGGNSSKNSGCPLSVLSWVAGALVVVARVKGWTA